MKKLSLSILSFCLLFVISFSCQQDEHLSPAVSNVTFSLSQRARDNGRINGTTSPAFVLLSIIDSNGKAQNNIKLPLFSFGDGYVSEALSLPTGYYDLTMFMVLDENNNVSHATPIEGSDLAKFVTDPLPIKFSVAANQTSQIVPQVLAVLEDDSPESFGYARFGFDVAERKLKSMSNFYYETSQIASEKFNFFYDDKGRLASYDRYVPGDAGTFRHEQHFVLGYYFEDSELFYKVTVWSVVDGTPDAIVGRRKVTLDANSNVVRDIIYTVDGYVLEDRTYSRFSGGYNVTIKRWIEEYEKYGFTKISYETDANGNTTRKRVYSSHFEGTEGTDEVVLEYLFTHDSKINPIYALHLPYFTDFTSLYRYADSESKNNVLKITPVGCGGYCDDVSFTYEYQDEFVTEVSPGGLLLYKRTFEYY